MFGQLALLIILVVGGGFAALAGFSGAFTDGQEPSWCAPVFIGGLIGLVAGAILFVWMIVEAVVMNISHH